MVRLAEAPSLMMFVFFYAYCLIKQRRNCRRELAMLYKNTSMKAGLKSCNNSRILSTGQTSVCAFLSLVDRSYSCEIHFRIESGSFQEILKRCCPPNKHFLELYDDWRVHLKTTLRQLWLLLRTARFENISNFSKSLPFFFAFRHKDETFVFKYWCQTGAKSFVNSHPCNRA